MDELLLRQMPHSTEAEQAVLGSMLIDAACVKDVMDQLQPDDFYLRQNREIFETIYTMFVYSRPIDGLTVAGELEKAGLANDGTRAYLAQLYPENLVERELQEVGSIRSNKNTKVIYSISFDEIKAAYNQSMESEAEAEPIAQDFLSYMVDTLQHALSIADKYDYDGISIGYVGKSILHMTEAEKDEYKQNEKAFIGIMNDWFQRHQDHVIVFEGNPQNLINKELLTNCSVIFVSCLDVNSVEKLTFNLQLAAVENVPLDKLAIVIPTASPNESDKETGYFADGTKILAGVVEWALSVGNIDVAGLGIYNISNDYYNPSMIFKDTRNAINTLNPSIKN